MSIYFFKMSTRSNEMSITKRQQQIIELLSENSFLSVDQLSKLTYTSPSSIRRDLTKLQNSALIKRTHGGAEIAGTENKPAPLSNRMTKNTLGKKKIAKKAAALIRDGMSVMLDGSSTAGFLIPHIARHKDVTLFTNNMITATTAINYGINTHCIGGQSVRGSAVLSGAAAYDTVKRIHTDILFFSSQSLDANGIISDSTEEENYLRSLMLENAEMTVFLCDSEKFGLRSLHTLTDIDNVDVAIFDSPFDNLKPTKCKII